MQSCHYCTDLRGEGPYFLWETCSLYMITGILKSKVNSTLSDYAGPTCMLLLLQLLSSFC